MMLKMFIKAADLGHSSLEWKNHFHWSCLVQEEFYQQGEEEHTLDLPVSPLCERKKHIDFPKSQRGFIEFVVEPLMKELVDVSPTSLFRNECYNGLIKNRQRWEELANKEEIAMEPSTGFIKTEAWQLQLERRTRDAFLEVDIWMRQFPGSIAEYMAEKHSRRADKSSSMMKSVGRSKELRFSLPVPQHKREASSESIVEQQNSKESLLSQTSTKGPLSKKESLLPQTSKEGPLSKEEKKSEQSESRILEEKKSTSHEQRSSSSSPSDQEEGTFREIMSSSYDDSSSNFSSFRLKSTIITCASSKGISTETEVEKEVEKEVEPQEAPEVADISNDTFAKVIESSLQRGASSNR